MPENVSQILIEAKRIAEAEVKPVSEKLSKTTTDLNNMERQVNEMRNKIIGPFYRDGRFWTGLLAIPSIIAAGHVLNWIAQSDVVLYEIHRALSTEPVLVSSMDRESNLLRQKIQTQMERAFIPRDDLNTTLGAAQALVEILNRDNISYADHLTLGIVHPEKINSDSCLELEFIDDRVRHDKDTCVIAAENVVTSGSSVFGMKERIDVTIEVWLSVHKLVRDGSHVDLIGITDQHNIGQLFSVTINGEELPLMISNVLTHERRRYRFDNTEIKWEDHHDVYPAHHITVQMDEHVARFVKADVVILIYRAV